MNGSLDLRVKRPPVSVDLSAIPSIASFHDAIAECARLAGSQDKSVALDTNIDNAAWTRIKQGDAGVKGDFLERLMDACGNELPLLWLVYQRGYDPACLHKRETELEKKVREADERADAAERELATIKSFLKDVKA